MLTDKRRWYVYVLSDPRTDAIFYVGKGSGRRAWCHTATPYSGLRSAKHERIAALERLGTPQVVTVLAHFEYERDALHAERELIARLPELTNISQGQNAEPLRRRLLYTIIQHRVQMLSYREFTAFAKRKGLPTKMWWSFARGHIKLRNAIIAMPK